MADRVSYCSSQWTEILRRDLHTCTHHSQIELKLLRYLILVACVSPECQSAFSRADILARVPYKLLRSNQSPRLALAYPRKSLQKRNVNQAAPLALVYDI